MDIEQFLDQAGTITLCGSTKFYDAYVAANRLLTSRGWTVLSCGQFGHSYHKEVANEQVVPTIKALHFAKILRSDAICVVNHEVYIGKSTQLEIDFSLDNGRSMITFESTGKHTGKFKLIEVDDIIYTDSTLTSFLSSQAWVDFVKDNPDYY